ncbi:hypothetical protein SDA99_13255 [Legionella pneumophila serogroup 10]
MSTTDVIVVRITGDSGDGVQLVGEQLTISAALTGRDVRTMPDFPAEIRAPALSDPVIILLSSKRHIQ